VSAVLPQIDELNRPFWDGCREGELRLQRCSGCGELRYPISSVCPGCLSTGAAWEAVCGRGSVYSFAVFRHAYGNAWSGRVPYDVAIVQLEEGPFLLSNVVGVAPEELRVGLPVAVVFEDEDGVAIPRFRPA
jgi:uncharacterized OB-fold protein